MIISNRLKEPHVEMNENGKQMHHPGYIEKKCRVCGNIFIVGRGLSKEYITCGRNGCKEPPEKDRQPA